VFNFAAKGSVKAVRVLNVVPWVSIQADSHWPVSTINEKCTSHRPTAAPRATASSLCRFISLFLVFVFCGVGSNLTILEQEKHFKTSACVSGYESDVAGEDVQEEMPLRTIITSVGPAFIY
jgi:hypothetical protein